VSSAPAISPAAFAAARALHGRIFTIDTHSDTPTASLAREGWDFAARHRSADDDSQCDLPRLADGGVDAMVFAIYVGQGARTPEGHAVVHDRARRFLDRTHEVLRTHAAHCGLALTAADGPALKAAGRLAIYLSLENAYSVGRDLGNLEVFHRAGVRMVGLTHMFHNDVADSSTDPRGPEWGGLSGFGRELVAECNRLGLVVDASHASDDALRDLLEVSQAPVVLSHSGCAAVCPHARNVGDELLRALAAKGGVIQTNALPISLAPDAGNRRTDATAEALLRFVDRPLTPETLREVSRAYHAMSDAHPNPRVSLDDFVRHVEHATEVAGVAHVGIGCDLDGGGGGFPGLVDVGDFPNITAALQARGWSEDSLRQLWGANTLRVFAAAEAVARR
jgi:membrane dipeptidase